MSRLSRIPVLGFAFGSLSLAEVFLSCSGRPVPSSCSSWPEWTHTYICGMERRTLTEGARVTGRGNRVASHPADNPSKRPESTPHPSPPVLFQFLQLPYPRACSPATSVVLRHLPPLWFPSLQTHMRRNFLLSQTSATLTSGADDADEENSCELSQYKVQALFKHSECIHCGQDYHYRHFYNEEAKVGRLLKVTQLVSIRGRIQNQGYEWHLLSAYYLSSAFI